MRHRSCGLEGRSADHHCRAAVGRRHPSRRRRSAVSSDLAKMLGMSNLEAPSVVILVRVPGSPPPAGLARRIAWRQPGSADGQAAARVGSRRRRSVTTRRVRHPAGAGTGRAGARHRRRPTRTALRNAGSHASHRLARRPARRRPSKGESCGSRMGYSSPGPCKPPLRPARATRSLIPPRQAPAGCATLPENLPAGPRPETLLPPSAEWAHWPNLEQPPSARRLGRTAPPGACCSTPTKTRFAGGWRWSTRPRARWTSSTTSGGTTRPASC